LTSRWTRDSGRPYACRARESLTSCGSSKSAIARGTSLTYRTADKSERRRLCSCSWTLTPSRACCARYTHWTWLAWNCAPNWPRQPSETCSAPDPNNPRWTLRLKPSWTRLSRASGPRLTWGSSGTKWWIQPREPRNTPRTCEPRACRSCRSSEDWICKWRRNPSKVSTCSLDSCETGVSR
jgi:hypothetical protein